MAMAAPVAAEVAGVSEASALGGATAAGGKSAAQGAAGTAAAGGKGAKGTAKKSGAKKEGRRADLRPGIGERSRKGRQWAWAANRRMLTVEYLACVVVLMLGTLLAPKGSKDGMPRAMVKGTALSALFFVLALVSAGGKGARQAATALGTLVTAAYLLTSSDVHNVTAWVAEFFSPKGKVKPTGEKFAPKQKSGTEKSSFESSTAQSSRGGGPEVMQA